MQACYFRRNNEGVYMSPSRYAVMISWLTLSGHASADYPQ